MEVISVMLVFESDDHTALKSVIISDNPRYASTLHDCTFMWFLLFSIIIFTGSPFTLAIPPSAGNCYNEQENDRFSLPCFVFCLRNLRTMQYIFTAEWFTEFTLVLQIFSFIFIVNGCLVARALLLSLFSFIL